MVKLGLDEFTFSEVFDPEKVEDGKRLAKIGKIYQQIYVTWNYLL